VLTLESTQPDDELAILLLLLRIEEKEEREKNAMDL